MFSVYKLRKNGDLSISVHYFNFYGMKCVMSCGMLYQVVIIFGGPIVIFKQANMQHDKWCGVNILKISALYSSFKFGNYDVLKIWRKKVT